MPSKSTTLKPLSWAPNNHGGHAAYAGTVRVGIVFKDANGTAPHCHAIPIEGMGKPAFDFLTVEDAKAHIEHVWEAWAKTHILA